MKPRPLPPTLDRQGRLLFVFMVVVGYILTFVMRSNQGARELTLAELVLGSHLELSTCSWD